MMQHSERRRTMMQESKTQEIPTPAEDEDDLTAAELALVVGGGDGGPGGPTDNTGRYGV
jgi:hypothetical protein